MVNNFTNINKTKESLNSDGQQFYQFQQNKPPPVTSNHLKKNIENTTYYIGKPVSVLGQAQQCGKVKLVNGIL